MGRIAEIGSEVTGFKQGDLVISPFSLSCGESWTLYMRIRSVSLTILGQCFYCQRSYTSRCASSILLGTAQNPGAQAEFLRIPLASSSLFHLDPAIPPELSLMLCDILPTGLTVATNARTLLNEDKADVGGSKSVCLVIGCGPVSVCL